MIKNLSKAQRHMLLRIIIGATVFASYYVAKLSVGINNTAAFLILTLAYVVLGYDVVYSAIKNICRGKLLDEQFLMCIATLGAYALGDFSEAAAVMLFYQTGEFFQGYAVGKSRRSIKELMNICPEYANLELDGTLKRVDPYEVEIGDVVVVKPGEKIPLDGVVTEGSSFLDTSSLTGESVRDEVGVGATVFSGSINLKGVLRIKVTKDFDNSTVSRILELVENSAFNKSKSEDFITRFARVYTPIVVVCALIVAIVPSLIFGSFALWLKRALIFLVISCPCALVISVPLSFFASIGCASKLGILIKGSNWLEALGRAQTVVFDKTGTLTKGNFAITAICPCSGVDSDQLLKIASVCEFYSDHPIAEVIKERSPVLSGEGISGFEVIAGCGVKAEYDGKTLRCGNSGFVSQFVASNIPESSGATVVHVSCDNSYLGYIEISDEIKPESARTVAALKRMGIKTAIFTGDSRQTGELVAKKTGCDMLRSELLPQDKTSALAELIGKKAKNKSVVFVGDGINDAPVLSLADFGIAMGSLGSDAAIEAADIVIMDDNLAKIPLAFSICKKTDSIVKQNVIFSISVKVGVMALAAFGFANMWAAVFADVGVAFIAILNAFRAFRHPQIKM